MDIEIMKYLFTKGEKIKTSFKDKMNNDVCLGDKLVTPSGVVYEVRIRNEKFILHTGGLMSTEISNIVNNYIIDNSRKLQYNLNIDLIA